MLIPVIRSGRSLYITLMFNLYIEKVTISISILYSDVQSKHVHDTCYSNNYIILCFYPKYWCFQYYCLSYHTVYGSDSFCLSLCKTLLFNLNTDILVFNINICIYICILLCSWLNFWLSLCKTLMCNFSTMLIILFMVQLIAVSMYEMNVDHSI